ncbi:HWE histidine kinase domain-containing protein [Methylobacterium nonmethylotrophicum]|uniref:histidine kinase n=1 Tax=Methylobacterium nonmethylotrophicum TaxID=1141884 RepID=A0A4Z0NCI6_9HYPH|nr:sensor histidine kinase [Methylobacterium nonmethylotrophicum]TGD91753.1 sensor histidine kinase [Methylobacterium nonmethylotrophicum]
METAVGHTWDELAATPRNAPTTEEARDAHGTRLLALSRAHNVLTQETWEGANLSDVVAQAIAMAFQELATNAVKYGALSSQTGHVAITWTKASRPACLCLRGSETGGPAVVEPPRRGFGSRLIERNLARDPKGHVEITFGKSGAICTIDAPIDRTLRQSNWI